MTTYRNMLPQLGDQQFLTDGGLETTLIFDDNLDLPEFAAFPLLFDRHGRKKLEDYYLSYLSLAQKKGWVLFWKVRLGAPAVTGV